MGCGPSSPEPTEPSGPMTEQPAPSDSPTELPAKNRGYRPSIVSLQIPKDGYGDDMSSDGMSDRSMDAEGQENYEYLCGTDVTLQWLLQKLSEKLGKEITEEPQWITERLNRPSWDDDYASSSVIRVTFGWESDEFPKSIILKLPVSKDKRDDEEGKFHYIMFKRECNVYEWTQKYPKIVAPKIYHIKRHSKEVGGSGCVVMEDSGEKGQQQDAAKGLTIADLPPSYYAHIIGNFDQTMAFFENQDVDHSRFVYTAQFFKTEYLHSTATESAEELGIARTLVHGEPYASNVFVHTEGKEERVVGLIDWTECHSGCFAEDLAKAICWNLSLKDRLECTSSLLETYHYHFTRYSNGENPLTVETIRKAYELFIPFAMVTLCGKVMQVKNRSDIEPLIERNKGLIQNVYATTRLMQEG